MPRSLAPLLAIALLALPGCYFSRRSGDVERTPTVDTGVGAAIIMPGQSAPTYAPGGAVAPGGAQVTSEGPGGSSSRSGPIQPSTGNLTMIGGSEIDKEVHWEGKEDPLVFKWMTAPLALVAAPFVAIGDLVRGDPEPGPEVPNTKPQRPETQRAAPQTDYETQQLEQMERELASAPGAAPAPSAAPRASARSAASPISIADELASLQRNPEAPHAARPQATQPLETRSGPGGAPATGDAARVADGIVDRDGDGRIDQWIYRADGEIVRKVLDQDFDGRPETTLHYDLESHSLARIEEDENGDGLTDAWTEYRAGQVVRRRADGDHDGQVDTWTYYRDGVITRHEQDTTGDGFRDRVGHYQNGQLVREETDLDADGRADVTEDFDANQRVTRRAEDLDRDGVVDVVSHYEDGRLARRELLDEPATGTR
jgi:hypothetical protein